MNTHALEITDQHVNRFVELVNQGIEAWTKAGKLLVQMVEENQNAYAIIRHVQPQISVEVLLAFEKIGRNQIYPYLLLEDSPGSTKLLALPYDLQVECYKSGVDIITEWKNGQPVVKRKNVSALTKKEASLAIGPSGPRSIADQKKLFQPVSNAPRERTSVSVSKTVPIAGKSVGRFAVRIGVGGIVVFEKTKALTSNCQRVELSGGIALIEIVEPITQ